MSVTARTITATKTGAYTAAPNEVVPCDPTAGAFSVALPSPINGVGQAPITIGPKLDAGGNAVTITTPAGTIKGTSSLAAQFDVVTYVSNGVDWLATTRSAAGGGGGGGITGITVSDEGTPLTTEGTTLNFVGAGVVASGSGATKTITIAGGGGGGASAPLVLTSPLATDITLIAKGAALQTADLQDWQTSAGVNKVAVRADGKLTVSAPGIAFSAYSADDTDYQGTIRLDSSLNFVFSRPVSIAEILSPSGGANYKVAVDPNAVKLYASASGGAAPRLTAGEDSVEIQLSATGTLVITPIATATADLQRWRSAGGGILTRIGKNGRVITAVGTAPLLADLVDGELAFSTDASGNLIVTSRVAGALKTATLVTV